MAKALFLVLKKALFLELLAVQNLTRPGRIYLPKLQIVFVRWGDKILRKPGCISSPPKYYAWDVMLNYVTWSQNNVFVSNFRRKMIRPVVPSDCAAMAEIYNHYILNTVVTFEASRPSSLRLKLLIVVGIFQHLQIGFGNNQTILLTIFVCIWDQECK